MMNKIDPKDTFSPETVRAFKAQPDEEQAEKKRALNAMAKTVAAQYRDDSLSPGTRLSVNGEQKSLGTVAKFQFHYRSQFSNNTLPSLTIVAPSSMATSKSSLMPMESSGSGGEAGWLWSSSRNARKLRNTARTFSAEAWCGAIVMHPASSRC